MTIWRYWASMRDIGLCLFSALIDSLEDRESLEFLFKDMPENLVLELSLLGRKVEKSRCSDKMLRPCPSLVVAGGNTPEDK